MPATSAWLASAEAAFNRNIAVSSQAAALAKRLEGTSLQVEVDGKLTLPPFVDISPLHIGVQM